MTTSEEIAAGVDAALAKLAGPAAPMVTGPMRVASGAVDAYTAKAIQDEYDAILRAPDGNQNNAINTAAFNLGTLVGAGAVSEQEAHETLLAAARAGNHPEGRAVATISSGLRAGMAQPRHPWPPLSRQQPQQGARHLVAVDAPDVDWGDLKEPADQEPADAPAAEPGRLPVEFYETRPELQAIRQAAHSRNRSADVAFLATLTRLSGMIPHHIRADTGIADYVSLNLFGALVGSSGAGKSTGVRVSHRLLEPPEELDFRDGLPIGSGEGMAEIFMGLTEEDTGEFTSKGDPITRTVRAQVRHNAFFYVDEGATLTRLMKERSGSTLGETLRSAAVGQTLGQTNASKDNTRYIPGGSYSMGLLVGFQPETAAPLFEDTAEGTPQRFLWATVSDPTIPDDPPPWPGPLVAWRNAVSTPSGALIGVPTYITFDPSIARELRRIDLANARGEALPEDVGPLDAHAPVMKIKVSSLLAILAGRLYVTTDDWALAEVVWRASCAARDWVISYAARQRRTELEKQTQARIVEAVRVDQARLEAEEARTDKNVDRLSVRIAAIVHETGGATRKTIRSRCAGRDKKYIADAISVAVLRGWVVEEEGQLVPGRSRPT